MIISFCQLLTHLYMRPTVHPTPNYRAQDANSDTKKAVLRFMQTGGHDTTQRTRNGHTQWPRVAAATTVTGRLAAVPEGYCTQTGPGEPGRGAARAFPRRAQRILDLAALAPHFRETEFRGEMVSG